MWFIIGAFCGVIIMALLSANAYEKGFMDGVRSERWRDHYPTLRR